MSMQMAEVREMVYCAIVLVGGGMDVMMACWNAWRVSDSLSSLHAFCSSCRLVISESFSL